MKANFNAFEEFLREYMPAFVGNFKVNKFYSLDIYRGRNFTRSYKNVKVSLFDRRPMNPKDTIISFRTHDNKKVYLGMDQAMDLALCMSFNLMNLEDKSRFNPFRIHFRQ